jgi:hypothetical protein
MEQVMGESKVEEDYQKAGGGKSLPPHCNAPLQGVQTQYLSNYWQWNSKTRKYERDESDPMADEPFCTVCRSEYLESLYR